MTITVGLDELDHVTYDARGDVQQETSRRRSARRCTVGRVLYRLAAEGPLRQTGWSYLELRRHPPGRSPALAEVREVLLADGSPPAPLIAGGIHTE